MLSAGVHVEILKTFETGNVGFQFTVCLMLSLPGSCSLSFSSWVRLTVRSRGASDVSDKGDEVLVVTPFLLVWSRHLDAYSMAN